MLEKHKDKRVKDSWNYTQQDSELTLIKLATLVEQINKDFELTKNMNHVLKEIGTTPVGQGKSDKEKSVSFKKHQGSGGGCCSNKDNGKKLK